LNQDFGNVPGITGCGIKFAGFPYISVYSEIIETVDRCQWAINANAQEGDMLGIMNKADVRRIWCIHWLYLAATGHFVVGLLMAWWGDSVSFNRYNQIALENFILIDNSSAKELHIWWLAIFGATLQAFSILLAALVYLGN
jgi:hypothetical protein